VRSCPETTNHYASNKLTKSRVAIAFDAPVSLAYLSAVIPPKNSPSPASIERLSILVYRSFKFKRAAVCQNDALHSALLITACELIEASAIDFKNHSIH
jgi:hypothetical protein